MTVYRKEIISQEKKLLKKSNFLDRNVTPAYCEVIPEVHIENKRAAKVYSYLGSLTNKRNGSFVFPSLKTIATNLDCSVSTIQRAIRYLEKQDYIERSTRSRLNGSQTSNSYKVKKIAERKMHFMKYATITVPNISKSSKMTNPYSNNNSIRKLVRRNSPEHRTHILKSISYTTFQVREIIDIYKYELKIRGLDPKKLVQKWKANRINSNCSTQNGTKLFPNRFMQDLENWIKREIKLKKPYWEFKKNQNDNQKTKKHTKKSTNKNQGVTKVTDMQSDLTFILGLKKSIGDGVRPTLEEFERVRGYYSTKDEAHRRDGLNSIRWALHCRGINPLLL